MSKLDKLTSWHSDWRDLRVVIFGLGVSGFSAADTLAELGTEVLVVAEKSEPEYLDLLSVLGVKTFLSTDSTQILEKLAEFSPDVVITSPGFRPDNEQIVWAIDAGIPIWTDIDLAWRLRDKKGKPADWI